LYLLLGGDRELKDRAGDGYINLALALLGKSKKGNTLMWREFKKEFDIENKNVDPVDIACWVGTWLTSR